MLMECLFCTTHSRFNSRWWDYIWFVPIIFNTLPLGWRDSWASTKDFPYSYAMNPSEGKSRKGGERPCTPESYLKAEPDPKYCQSCTVHFSRGGRDYQNSTSNHSAPFHKSHGWSEGNTRPLSPGCQDATDQGPPGGCGFMNTWEQACQLVFKQFHHFIKGFNHDNENQSSRPKCLFWKYLFFKDFAF